MAKNDENHPPPLHSLVEPEEDDDLAPFSAVLDVLRLDAVPEAASELWSNQYPHDPLLHPPLVGAPLHGSFNILFPVEFGSHGVRWLLKVPINGTASHWDAVSGDQLASEAWTMRLIRQRTSIPIPEVFGFCNTLDNPLGCPHMWLSFIPGISLHEFWFAQAEDVSDEERHRRRTGVLQEIAAVMVQLGQFSFDMGGRLLFDDSGSPSGIGPHREMDHNESFQRRMQDEPDYMPVYYPSGPFKTVTEFFTAAVSREPPPDSDYFLGQRRLLEFLINCATDFFAAADASPFTLAHPDFGFQNILVSPDGRLAGIIDWEGVAAVPACLGNLRYPSWLTRDWDPSMYGYGSDGVLADPEMQEDSPRTLARCRKVYQNAIRDALGENGNLADNKPDLTSGSLITENLAIAAGDLGNRGGILGKIVKEIAAVVKVPCDDEEFLCMELRNAWAQGRVDKQTRQALKTGLEKLLLNKSL